MHLRSLSSALGSAAFVVVCASAVPAFGQTDEQRAGARSLATEGASAFSDGRYKDAVELFSKAESLVHAPPHLLFMARAHTKLGQLVRAREAYLKITREQLAPGSPPAFRDAQNAATREMAAIDPKIGGLAIKVEGADAAKDLQVKIDGNPVPSVLVGVSQPVDPGEHHIEAVATGFRAQPRALKVGDGEKTSVTLKLEVDASAAPVAATAATAPKITDMTPPASGQLAASNPTAPPPPSDSGSGGSGGMRIGAYSAFGIGAVGIGLGTVFMLKASSTQKQGDDLFDACNPGCTSAQKSEIGTHDDDAKGARTIGVVGFVVGGASVATGVALLLLDKGPSDPKAAVVRPWMGLGSAGLAGRF